MTCKRYNKLLKLCYIFIIYLFFDVESFTPVKRNGHSSALVGNQLYFFGGFNGSTYSNEVFYLDVSQRFDSGLPPWTDLTLSSGISNGSSWATTIVLKDNNNNPTIYLIFGDLLDRTIISLVQTFNPKSGQWSVPIIAGNEPIRRSFVQAVADDAGKIYVFGGATEERILLNDMVILSDLTWSYGSIDNVPSKRTVYTATLLSNGIIAYIGGLEVINDIRREIDFNQIDLYDTKLNTWSVMRARNVGQIESRYGHSAVLVQDGKIIIYGGGKGDDNKSIKATPDLAVLNTQTNPFEWSEPQLSSNIDEFPSLSYHTANLVGVYVIIAFGRLVHQNGLAELSQSNKIYLLDTRNTSNYIWVDKFEPNSISEPSSNTNTPSSNTTITTPDSSKTTNVIIGTISGIVGAAALIIIGIFGFKWYQKRKQNEIMRIAGDI